eukprot:g18613.t1
MSWLARRSPEAEPQAKNGPPELPNEALHSELTLWLEETLVRPLVEWAPKAPYVTPQSLKAVPKEKAEGFYAASRAERLDGRSAQEYSQQELDLFFDALPKDEEGKVDFQLVRNYIGGFIQMRRVLCDVAGWRDMMKLYLEKAFEHPAVKRGLAGAFGYCLGGQSCLEHVRAGHPVQAVCSLHGLLHSRPTTAAEPFNSKKRMSQEEYAKICPANNYNKDCRILIENGDKDEEDFVAEMDAQSIDWRFHNHARGPHGFALGPGVPGCEYTEHIDRRSTLDMLSLFAETWPEFDQHPVECNASGTSFHGFVPWKKRRQNLWSTAAVGILAGAATARPAMRIAVCGSCYGELDRVYEASRKLAKQGIHIELLICCGDFMSVRDEIDLEHVWDPPRGLEAAEGSTRPEGSGALRQEDPKDFPKYFDGRAEAPVTTVFVGGRNEASNLLREHYYGGWVAPRIYYLGPAGVVRCGPLRIAGIWKHGPYETLIKQQELGENQKREMEGNNLGSPAAMELLKKLRPPFWFSASLQVRFPALVNHGDGTFTRFLACERCRGGKEFLQVLDIDPRSFSGLQPLPSPQWQRATPAPAPRTPLCYDVEWMALQKAGRQNATATVEVGQRPVKQGARLQ